jgi:hypothetical protein
MVPPTRSMGSSSEATLKFSVISGSALSWVGWRYLGSIEGVKEVKRLDTVPTLIYVELSVERWGYRNISST